MLAYLKQSILLTFVLLVVLALAYPLLIVGIAKVAGPNGGKGEIIEKNGKIVGFANVAQSFTSDQYFNSRPSAFNYDATGGSYGSNLGPSNPDYLAAVQARIDTFLQHNPEVRNDQIPSELVTASGSGLDPDLSPEAAAIQIPRIARVRHLNQDKIRSLVEQHTKGPMLGLFGPSKVNVLRLNLALDELK